MLHKNKIPLALIPTVYENVAEIIQKYTIPCGAWSTAKLAAPVTLNVRTSEINPYPHGHPMFMSHGTPITDEEAKAWKEKFLKECAEKGIVFKNGVGLGEVSTAQRPGSPKGCTLSFAGTGAHRHSFPNTWKPNPEDYVAKDPSTSSTLNDPENNNS